MKKCHRHIALLMVMILSVFSSCRKDEAEVIPRAKLSKIYAEMLVTDQWITTTPGIRMIADTSLVYEPILQKYGYDSDDYRKSVDHYMNDPERFSRILRTSAEIIDKKIEELKHEQRIMEARARLPKIKTDFRPTDFVPYLGDEPYVHFYDSLVVELDTAMLYRLVSLERADTIYDRLRMIIVDSLYMNDSIPRLDSILASDMLLTKIGADSLRKLRLDTVKVEVKADTAELDIKADTAVLDIKPVRKARIMKKDL